MQQASGNAGGVARQWRCHRTRHIQPGPGSRRAPGGTRDTKHSSRCRRRRARFHNACSLLEAGRLRCGISSRLRRCSGICEGQAVQGKGHGDGQNAGRDLTQDGGALSDLLIPYSRGWCHGRRYRSEGQHCTRPSPKRRRSTWIVKPLPLTRTRYTVKARRRLDRAAREASIDLPSCGSLWRCYPRA